MATDNVQIGNMALSRIGVTVKIDSLDPPLRTKEAVEIAQFIDDVRDRVLAAAHWPFARKTVSLQKTGDTPAKWLYRYAYPNDCVAVRFLFPAGIGSADYRSSIKTLKTPFELEEAADGSLTICTDLDEAVLEYTVRVTNPTRFDSAFTSAFVWLLAAEIALPLAKTVEHSTNANTAYARAISIAIAKQLNEEVTDPQPDSEFIRARY